MSYEYYNPSSIDHIGRSAPEDPDPQGCLWQALLLMIIFALLAVIYWT